MGQFADIRLRRLTLDDSAVIANALADGRVARWTATIPHPYSLEDALRWIADVTDEQRGTRGFHDWGIQAGDSLAGVVSLQCVDRRANVAYWVTPCLWGHGIASRAVALVALEARALNVEWLEGHCLRENAPSRAVLLRNGFVPQGFMAIPWRGGEPRTLERFLRPCQ